MDCLSTRLRVVWWSGQAKEQRRRWRWPVQQVSLVQKGRKPRRKIVCSSYFPKEPAVFTAFRLNASALRIIGPGSNFITGGVGSLLAVDEFFVHQFNDEELQGPYQSRSLTYFLEENEESDLTEQEASQSVKHGIQVLFQIPQTDASLQDEESKSLSLSPRSLQVKDSGSVETFFLESAGDKGGAKVRVVAGHYESFRTSIQQNFVLLDILMRPGSVVKIPLHPSCGLILYILEGVGIFRRHPSSRTFYENEGHGIWFPQIDKEVVDSALHVTCHMWSSLRFLTLKLPAT